MALVKDKLVDVRVDAGATQEAMHYGVIGTANNVRQQYMPASASLSTVDWTVTTPSQSVFVDRRVSVAGVIPFKFTAWNYGLTPYTLIPHRDVGIASLPFNSLINTGTVQINTSNFTTQVQQTLPLLKRRLREKDTRDLLSAVPTSFSTVDILAPPGVLPYVGGPFDPKAADEEDCFPAALQGLVPTNTTGWVIPAAVAGVPGSLVCYGRLTIEMEPLLLEPFLVDDDTPGMVNVNVLNVRLNLSTLDDQMARSIRFAKTDLVNNSIQGLVPRIMYSGLAMTSRGEGGVAAPSQPVFEDSLRLWVTYLSPPFTAGTPAKSIYPYVHYNPLTTRYSKPSGVTPYDPIIVTSNLITLNVCPDLLALYFVPDYPRTGPNATNDNKTWGTTLGTLYPPGSGYNREDPLFFPDRISITWNNNATLLNTLTATDLQRMTARNGFKGATRNRNPLLNTLCGGGFPLPRTGTELPWVGTFVGTGAAYTSPILTPFIPEASVIINLYDESTGAPPIEVPLATWTGQGFTTTGSVLDVVYSYTICAPSWAYYFLNEGVFTTAPPLLVAMNKDLPVEAGVSAGTAGIYTLQVTYETRNFSNYNMTSGTFYVTPIYSQYFTTYAGATSTVDTAVLDEETFAKMPVSGDTASSQAIGGAGPSQDVKIVANSRQRLVNNLSNALTAKPAKGGGAEEGGAAGKRHRSIMGAL